MRLTADQLRELRTACKRRFGVDARLWLFGSRTIDPFAAVAACQRLQGEAESQELLAIAMRAKVFRIDALRRSGDLGPAAALAREVTAEWHACRPADLEWPEALWTAYQALRDAGDAETASALLKEAVDWITNIARSHVPAPFRDSFLQRNLVNRDVLAEAARRAA